MVDPQLLTFGLHSAPSLIQRVIWKWMLFLSFRLRKEAQDHRVDNQRCWGWSCFCDSEAEREKGPPVDPRVALSWLQSWATPSCRATWWLSAGEQGAPQPQGTLMGSTSGGTSQHFLDHVLYRKWEFLYDNPGLLQWKGKKRGMGFSLFLSWKQRR